MKPANPILAAAVEIVRVPFSPFIELGGLMDTFSFSEPMPTKPADGLQAAVVAFQAALDDLVQERAELQRQLSMRIGLASGVERLRTLSARFRDLEREFRESLQEDPEILSQAVAATRAEARELDDLAIALAKDLRGEPPPGARPDVAKPDSKKVMALDRLGFTEEDFGSLDPKKIQSHYLERARKFHPDGKDASEKAFYEDYMKNINEAKDYLLSLLGR